MRNETDVVNLALGTLGKSFITSMDEATQTAAIARQHYDSARRAQLSRSDWIFARAVAPLARVEEVGLYHGWYRFARPADFIKLRAVSSPDGTPFHRGRWTGPEFRMDAGYVSVDGPAAMISYIRDHADVSEWPPLFAETVAYKLASMLAPALTGRNRDAADAMALAETMLLRAIETDAAQERATYARPIDVPAGPMPQTWPIVPGVTPVLPGTTPVTPPVGDMNLLGTYWEAKGE